MMPYQTCNDFVRQHAPRLCALGMTEREAQQEVWWMLEALTKKSKTALLLCQSGLTVEAQATFEQWMRERVYTRKPLQYILGSVPFAGLEILVEPPILIPRPETEEIVQSVIQMLLPVSHAPLRILDLCTGTGCIALALARALPNATVVGVDIEPQAVALAEKNRVHNGIANATFVTGDLFGALDPAQKFDLIVSNPPYITSEEYASLEPEVKQWESEVALVACGDGLLFYRRIAQEACLCLDNQSIINENGLPMVVCEVGTDVEGVIKAFLDSNFSEVRLNRDMQGVYRWAMAWI